MCLVSCVLWEPCHGTLYYLYEVGARIIQFYRRGNSFTVHVGFFLLMADMLTDYVNPLPPPCPLLLQRVEKQNTFFQSPLQREAVIWQYWPMRSTWESQNVRFFSGQNTVFLIKWTNVTGVTSFLPSMFLGCGYDTWSRSSYPETIRWQKASQLRMAGWEDRKTQNFWLYHWGLNQYKSPATSRCLTL